MPMPHVWTPDDLQFADVRAAHFELAAQVAGDLLAAAGQPESRLKGVTAAQASLRAADLLIAAGDRDRAAIIARRVLQDFSGREEKLRAACLLAKVGDQGAAEALAAPTLSALHDRPDPAVIGHGVSLALDLANGEHYELAARVADETTAGYARWAAGPGRRADRTGTLGSLVELTRQTVLTVRQDAQDLAAGRRADEPGMQPSMLPSWPAAYASRFLWWPEAEYQRIVRQAPDVRSFLGVTWRDHTATVESAMLTLVPAGPPARPGGASACTLTAADFERFCGYVRLTGADPRLATTMTGFTAHLTRSADSGAPGARQPDPWPPGERSRCWCGSNAPYRRCCGRHG